MRALTKINFSKRKALYPFYFLILLLIILQNTSSQYNLTKYDFQENGISVDFLAITTTVNGNLICSTWSYSSKLINYFGLKKNGRPYFIQNGKETNFYNTTTTQPKSEGVIFSINLKNSQDNKEYIISFGNNAANFELYNFNIEPAEIFNQQGTTFLQTGYNSFSQVSFFNLRSSKDTYILALITNNNDESSTKTFLLYKMEFNKKDINDDTQIIKKLNIGSSYDAYISSCFETESGIFLCFYATSENSLRIAAVDLESSFGMVGQLIKSRDYFNENLFYKCVHFSGNLGAFLYYRTENEVIISFVKYESRVADINKDITINNTGYSNNIGQSDFIKLSDKKVCFFSVSTISEEIKLLLVINYQDELFKTKEYHINIYETNQLRVYGGLKSSIFNEFIALNIVGQFNDKSIKNSFCFIFSYPNSEDSEYDITNDLINSILPQINFNEKGNIENNIFDFIHSGFIIYDFPEGLILLDSLDNREITRNSSLVNDNIAIIFDENINFENDLVIEFALTAKEPECEIYSDETINNGDCAQEKDFENLKTYIGKTSYLKIIIDWSKISKECNENCFLCNTNTDKECYKCKNTFKKSTIDKSKCISDTIVEEQLTSQVLNEQMSSTIIETENNKELSAKEINNDIRETEKQIEITTNNLLETENKIEITQTILKDCNEDKILRNQCTKGKITIDQYDNIKNSILTPNNTNQNTIIKTETMVIQLSSLEDQKNSDNSNISSIDLGDCENKLRLAYNLSDDEDLIIYKVDIKSEDLSNTYVIYEVYDSSLNQLNLSHCQDTKISISVPVQLEENLNTLVYSLTESGYDIFNGEDSFYNDICSTYTSQNGADMLLSDRKSDIYTNIQNNTFCQTGCELESYNATTKKAKCNCDVEIETVTQVTAGEESFSKKEIAESFYKTLTNSNFQVMKCFKLIIDFERIVKNYGEILMTVLFFIFIVLMIIYCIKGTNSFYKIIYDILETQKLYSNIKNKENILIYDQSSNTTSQFKASKISYKDSKSKLNEIKNTPPKKVKKDSKSKKNKNKKNRKKHKLQETSKNKLNSTGNKKEINDLNIKGNKKKFNEKILNVDTEKNDENEKFGLYYKYLNDEEKNNLEYEKAVIYDKRTYFQYYFSLLKKKQLILFTFLPANDYNLIYVKIALFIVSFSLYFTINGFFFTDETMHDIYEDNGVFNILYQIPQILYSSIISSLINVLLKQLSLSEKNILEIKKLENDKNIQNNEKVGKIQKYLKVKLILFFIFSFLLMSFFWYFISCFCAVYINTQSILIKDTLISFATSMIYPFGLCLLPGFFRIPSLKSESSGNICMYKFSIIVAFI